MRDPRQVGRPQRVAPVPGRRGNHVGRAQRRRQDDPTRRVHADPGPGDAAGRAAAHRAFRRVSIDVPWLEVDTTDGYRPSFGQILSFISEGP